MHQLCQRAIPGTLSMFPTVILKSLPLRTPKRARTVRKTRCTPPDSHTHRKAPKSGGFKLFQGPPRGTALIRAENVCFRRGQRTSCSEQVLETLRRIQSQASKMKLPAVGPFLSLLSRRSTADTDK